MKNFQLLSFIFAIFSCLIVINSNTNANETSPQTFENLVNCYTIYDTAVQLTSDETSKTYYTKLADVLLGNSYRLFKDVSPTFLNKYLARKTEVYDEVANFKLDLEKAINTCNQIWPEFVSKVIVSAPKYYDFYKANSEATKIAKRDNALTCTIVYQFDLQSQNGVHPELSKEYQKFTGQEWARLKIIPDQTDDISKNILISSEINRLTNLFKSDASIQNQKLKQCDDNWGLGYKESKEKAAKEANDAEERRKAAEAVQPKFNPQKCNDLENRATEIIQLWGNAKTTYNEEDGDLGNLRWKFDNLKMHLENIKRDAGYNQCNRLNNEIEYVLNDWKRP